MIDKILEKVEQNIGDDLASNSGILKTQVAAGLQTVSASVLSKAKEYLDNGKIMELKDIFTGGDTAEKEAFLSEMKGSITSDLKKELSITEEQSSIFVNSSISEIIQVSKEELLGPDGKIGIADLPRLMSFFKSEGKEVKSNGGLGGLFGM